MEYIDQFIDYGYGEGLENKREDHGDDLVDFHHTYSPYDVQVGELVTTSGLGGKFPENLVIGRVIDVERNEAELFQRAVVQPAVDFNAVEIVFVVTEFNTINTEIFSEEP